MYIFVCPSSFISFFQVQEVQSYLDPATADEMTLSDAAKTEIILAGKISNNRNIGCNQLKIRIW